MAGSTKSSNRNNGILITDTQSLRDDLTMNLPFRTIHLSLLRTDRTSSLLRHSRRHVPCFHSASQRTFALTVREKSPIYVRYMDAAARQEKGKVVFYQAQRYSFSSNSTNFQKKKCTECRKKQVNSKNKRTFLRFSPCFVRFFPPFEEKRTPSFSPTLLTSSSPRAQVRLNGHALAHRALTAVYISCLHPSPHLPTI